MTDWASLLTRGSHVDLDGVRAGLVALYDGAPPEIVICDSPAAALRAARAHGDMSPDFDLCGAFIADAVHQRGLTAGPWRLLLEAGVFDTILYNDLAIVLRCPERVLFDDNGLVHCEDGPAVVWLDGATGFAWHGEVVPASLILAPGTMRHVEIAALSPGARGALARLGWPRYAALLGGRELDVRGPYALVESDHGDRVLRRGDLLVSVPEGTATVREALRGLAGAVGDVGEA